VPAKPADRRGGAEGAQHAGTVPALGAERGIIEADPDPRRRLASGGDGHEEVAARQGVALGDRQGGRHHFRRHMGQRRAVHVAHGDRGDEITIEKCRAGERQPVAADDAALVGLRQSRRERGELLRLFAAVPGDRARQGIEQEVLAVISHLCGKIVVLQRGRKAGQHLSDVARHTILLCAAFFAETAPPAIDPQAS